MYKRLLCLGLGIVMMLSMCGCGKSSSYKIKTTISAKDATQSRNNKKELSVWCWDPAFNISAVKEAAKIYKKTHPDVSVKVTEVAATDIIAQMSTAIKAGNYENLPDILLMKDNNLSENLDYYDGVFADLTDSGINYSDLASYKADMGVYNGKHYTVPFDSGAAILCLREDLIEKAGYTIKDFENITWSDFIKKGKVVKEKTGLPVLTCQKGSSDFIMMLVQSGGAWLYKDGKPYIYKNKVLREAMRTYKELIDTGVLKEVNNWNAYTASINNGRVAGTLNGCWIISTIKAQKDQSGKWRVTNIPKLNKIKGATNYSNCGGSSWLVMDSSKQKETAIDFLKSTFGSSTDLYSNILPISGALGTYLPASKSEVYTEQQEFFGNEAIYKQISEYTAHVHSIETGIHNATAYDQASIYLIDYVNGKDLDKILKAYQSKMDALD